MIGLYVCFQISTNRSKQKKFQAIDANTGLIASIETRFWTLVAVAD